MAEIGLRTEDTGFINLLRKCNNNELKPLVEYITGKGFLTSELEDSSNYKMNKSAHVRYVDEIAAEIQKFGGNTLANIARGGKGVLHHEIVCDVANKLKVNFNEKRPTEDIEVQIMLKILEKAWEKMTDEEKRALLGEVSDKYKSGPLPTSFPLAALQAYITVGGGFHVVRTLAMIIAGEFAKIFIAKGARWQFMKVAVTHSSKALSALSGPIGWAITGIWTMVDVSGPAYRVTIPCVLHIAMLRQVKKEEK